MFCRFFGDQQLSLIHVWFKSYVVKWIDLAAMKCKKGITEAIKNDKVRPCVPLNAHVCQNVMQECKPSYTPNSRVLCIC